jgi:hypothetical protein
MRRFICGLVSLSLLLAARPGQLAAQAPRCYWVETGRDTIYYLDGGMDMVIYYKYFCNGQPNPV